MSHCKIDHLQHRFQDSDLRCSLGSKRHVISEYDPPRPYQIDGLADSLRSVMPFRMGRLGGDVSAIFVHAGAGYHSTQNERVHLEACALAAKTAMASLRNGASAVEAVELAIRVLEDSEITNAGYGSNLAMDGTVECDATIVDHFGRSGAVGAMGHILNPIHVARLILQHSTQPMSLRRVPPNLLVGQGAIDYAFESGVPIMPADALVSWSSRERWIRWRKDLHAVEEAKKKKAELEHAAATSSDSLEAEKLAEKLPESYMSELAGTWNESQPYSPLPLTATTITTVAPRNLDLAQANEWPHLNVPQNLSTATLAPMPTQAGLSRAYSPTQSLAPFMASAGLPVYSGYAASPSRNGHDGNGARFHDMTGSIDIQSIDTEEWNNVRDYPMVDDPTDVSPWSESSGSESGVPLENTPSATPEESLSGESADESSMSMDPNHVVIPPEEDVITDTVGAIAIDSFGNIAAGSSSGGIGMKHKGRAGPAALVGIGTHVIPLEPADKSKTCVATVTSGTGEHMATTLAAAACAKRIYSCEVKGRDGKVKIADEEAAIKAFVETDFMDHPSVRNSHSAGAIGVMAVKKSKDGLWLHFAHNTDSFALASMSSSDPEPRCVMSRGPGDGHVITGARSFKSFKFRRHKPATPSKTALPSNYISSNPIGSSKNISSSVPALPTPKTNIPSLANLSTMSIPDSVNPSMTSVNTITKTESFGDSNATTMINSSTARKNLESVPTPDGSGSVVSTDDLPTKTNIRTGSATSTLWKRTSRKNMRRPSDTEVGDTKRIKTGADAAEKVPDDWHCW